MRKERKQELMIPPEVPKKYMDKMQGKYAANFVVLVTSGRELFARCFHRYSKGDVREVQRYAFAKDGAVRYGRDERDKWVARTELREPVFYNTHGYGADNSYTVLGWEAVAKSDMKYSEVTAYTGRLIVSYLCLYCRHPNIEYLMKAGYDCVFEEYVRGYWGYCPNALRVDGRINLKSNNLLKMLGLSRTEFKALAGREKLYPTYMIWRDRFPKLSPDDLILLYDAFGSDFTRAERTSYHTGLTAVRIAKYLVDKDIRCYDYEDHIKQCLSLGYDLHDTAYSLPHDFYAFHQRASAMVKYNTDKLMNEAFAENYNKRKVLEFRMGNLIAIQPESCDDIIREGRVQKHCVGGYAERHAYGKLHIMFIRKVSQPDKPYYTMEVSADGRIVQCRGYCNDRGKDKPLTVLAFEKEYQAYLDGIFNKRRKSA